MEAFADGLFRSRRQAREATGISADPYSQFLSPSFLRQEYWTIPSDQLTAAVHFAAERFRALQNERGYWVFDLEADSTITSEYLLLHRFLERPLAPELREAMAGYLRRCQLPDSGWPLYHGGPAEVSATVKAYFALKLAGDPPESPHLARARSFVLSRGGAERVNVFTRITLALFGQLAWQTTPAMPVEIVLLPRWFYFHLEKVSYWSRTVIVPLLLLYARQPVCRLGPEEGVAELFVKPPETISRLDNFRPRAWRRNSLLLLDRLLKGLEPAAPHVLRRRAIQQAEAWTLERMQGEGGIGAIFPAMANAVMALKVLGYPADHPEMGLGLKALDDLVVRRGEEAFCQPCNSPVWDTCLGVTALLEAGTRPEHPAVQRAVDWLCQQQIRTPGDWSRHNPELEPGGWAFQFENSFYPDIDDTSMVVLALLRAGALHPGSAGRLCGRTEKVGRAVRWVLGLQGADGGWGAFDRNNNRLYLNEIPFADHGALLDPSTADLTARCLEMLAMLGFGLDFPPIARGLAFLERDQEPTGAWYGRWGVNYLYGTWAVLSALGRFGEEMLSRPLVRRAAAWLKMCQNSDQGWGESCCSYDDPIHAGRGDSTPSQTAWALLGLMAAGEGGSDSVRRGINYLLENLGREGAWSENHFTGTGFPRFFYLRYTGYSHYFPLWALGVYRRLQIDGVTQQDVVQARQPAVFLLNPEEN